jgi:hypothetical protein
MLANDTSVPLVVTYDNAPNEFTYYFTKTLNRQEWDYKIVGEGEVWEGWQTRMKAYRNYLYTLPDEKIVVLSDARDVVCVRSPRAFMDAFHSFQDASSNFIVLAPPRNASLLRLCIFCHVHVNTANS